MQTIKDIIMILKYYAYLPIINFKTKHALCCPSCYKVYYQLRKYKPGQVTLCKKCRNIKKKWNL